MEYTRLGTSGLKISRIALGCMSFGRPGTGRDWALDGEPIVSAKDQRGVALSAAETFE